MPQLFCKYAVAGIAHAVRKNACAGDSWRVYGETRGKPIEADLLFPGLSSFSAFVLFLLLQVEARICFCF